MVAGLNHVSFIFLLVLLCSSSCPLTMNSLTPVAEKEQIATRADLKLCEEAEATGRSERHDQNVDRAIDHSEKALKVGALALGLATTMAGLAKVAKA